MATLLIVEDAVSAMLENMILGVGKYKDRGTYPAKCKVLTDRLSQMIKETYLK